ncbi:MULTISPECIES: ESX secretion-associated protein EspG [unclassified Gordonia (in: high G+C Gram-positive bacteria)]|uniref:ESX secretion-associated protein EspG n=1 Tax=unclassified Gordonia (in: high G+C Gram-positive bacteria) TaxID=2657482 RepID=UPI001F0D0745|nr:ESX secretion-associated protein EspG [Gordonia sp. ABSL49_1]MCH5642230.1 ESX secretion-associated protein EspG [Gordonia sp. ABSL49_1]
MTTTDMTAIALDVAVLRRLGERHGVQTWPVVLDVDGVLEPEPARMSPADLDARIVDLGLWADDEPVAWLGAAMRVLSTPDRTIEVRTFTDDGVRRMCLARAGNHHALAVRDGTDVHLRLVDLHEADALGPLFQRELGECAPCSFGALSHPTDDFTDRLGSCRTGLEMTDALHALGASPTDAMMISAALASCRARTEIVAIAHDAGVLTQSSGAVAVFDTGKGRIVSSPSKSLDGRLWTTLSPGTGHRITQAIGLLIETLPDSRWFP